MLELVNVKKIYTTKAGDTAALNDLSVTFPANGLVFVTGKSGSGKTTLLNVVGGLDGIDEGDIVIQGKKFSEFSDEEYDSYRNTFVGFIFQEYNLLSEYTVEKNIRIANELQGVESNIDEINKLLKEVDLEGLNNRLPSQLSGGQKQRVAIARALIKNPKIIMADEPTGALDSVTGVQVLETLKKLSKERLVLVVSHDLELAERYADRIIRLVDGKLVEDITLEDKTIEGNTAENEKDFIVKAGADLTKQETNDLVMAVKNKKNIVLSENITVRNKKATEYKEEKYNGEQVKLVSSKMKYRSAAELGLKSLVVKPLRLAFTILLSVIAFAVFGLFDTIASFENTKVLANLINNTREYNAIQISTEHVGSTETTKLTFSDAEIKKIKTQTGFNFRPIYDVNDKNYTGISKDVSITETLYSNHAIGKDYYMKSIDGFIEFGVDEITSDGIIDKNGFNYKILYGEYPTLKYKEGGVVDEDSFYNIAISSYMAESIIYWLQGNALNGQMISTPEELVVKNATITLSQKMYTIVGIIDCGEIPTKYDILKSKIPSKETNTLAGDLKTYINSGGYLLGYVADGYVEEYRKSKNRIVNYYTNEYKYTIDSLSVVSDTEDTRFYKASDIQNEKVVLFERAQYDKDGNKIVKEDKNILKDNEILISFENFKKMYRDEVERITGYKNYYSDKYTEATTILGTPLSTIERKQEAVEMLVEVFDKCQEPLVKHINLLKTTKGTAQRTSNQMKVVGFYFDVNNDIGASTTAWFPFAVNEATLETLGVYSEQGYYSKLIAPLASAGLSCLNTNGGNYLANCMTKESGMRIKWHNNEVLSMIDENGKMITDLTDLVLIIAIVLALFSVFMLFNYISTSIVAKRQSIGVLRALGSNSKNVFSMFITESLVISIINGVFASLVAWGGATFVNLYIRNVMDIALDFAIFGGRQIVIIFIAGIVTGVVSSILPIIKICKEKPVDLIRKP